MIMWIFPQPPSSVVSMFRSPYYSLRFGRVGSFVLFCLTATALVLCGNAQARPTKAFTVQMSGLYAGPAAGYPQLERLTPQTPVTILGCLPDFGWCDVLAGDQRGWMNTRTMGIIINGYGRPVSVVAPDLDIPVTPFALGPYWSTHYRNQPWFHDPQFAPALETYRVRSQTGNTTIEIERSWHAQPQFHPPIYIEPNPQIYVQPPAVIYAPAPAYPPPPPPIYQAAPTYPQPPIYVRPGYGFPPNNIPPPARVNPLRPANGSQPGPSIPEYTPSERPLPGNQFVTPNGRVLK